MCSKLTTETPERRHFPYFDMDFPQLGRKLLDLYVKYRYIGEALRNLVPFVQFKNIENTHKGPVTFSKKTATLLKVTLLHGCFSRF